MTQMKMGALFYIFLFIALAESAILYDFEEEKTLISIKASLIDPLDHLRDWKLQSEGVSNTSSHCNWTGVVCNSNGAVVKLDLSHMNLSGRVSDEIQSIKNLAFLNICCNVFSSSLPRSLFNLTMLKNMDVSQNFFVGSFPAGLDKATGLISINASSNNFSGPLPEEFGNLTMLESLDFRGSFFQGEIPTSYKNLHRLKFLGLSGNNLAGRIPKELGQLSSLETIIIGYNGFHGKIPVEFGNLTNLQYLDIAVANLDGGFPAELGRLNFLNTIFLYRNNIDGTIPEEIGNIGSLELLDLSDNLLSGDVPEGFGRLKNLQLLNLMCNRFNGTIPASIGELTRLQVLELWNNSFTGSLPADLGKNSPLVWLDVSSNSFTGDIPPGLCNAGNLTKLILFNNGFSGVIPYNLSKCSSLIRVRIQNNLISGSIPSGFGSLQKLQRLELANNSLTGGIPNDLSLSNSLSFIDISENNLFSDLPSNILAIPDLQTFIASKNNLTGQIPDQFQDCPNLAVLDLSNNRLSGYIPASLGSCEKLVKLNLMNNNLTGVIPPSIAMMPALAILDLSCNLLTGAIPQNFGSSPALEMFNVSYNNLSGLVPTDGMLRSINPDELAGNPGLCGAVLPPCSLNSGRPSLKQREKKGQHIKHIFAGFLVGMSIVLGIVLAFAGSQWLYKRYYYSDGCCNQFSSRNGEWPWRLTAFQRLSFSSNEILACVKESNVIGMGATGIVYRAEIQRPRMVVAVKKLWRGGDDMERGGDIGEVELLGRLRHRNIVRLLGYLNNDTNTMLVYEYMENGSLGEALHGKRLLTDWVSRYNVAVGIAQGLAYLHHDCFPPVIHRDIKSNNILLDSNMEARIADFGLARMMENKNQTVSMVAGSYGYIAPEYGYSLKVDEKSDIYSFGVVLMELLTGKRPLEAEYGDGVDIVEWIREKIRCSTGIEHALDPNVGGQCKHVQEEMLLVLRIALLCTAKLPRDRPSMRDVVTMLGEAKPRRKSSSIISNASKDKPVFTLPNVSSLL